VHMKLKARAAEVWCTLLLQQQRVSSGLPLVCALLFVLLTIPVLNTSAQRHARSALESASET
jgi:hypothetical protein